MSRERPAVMRRNFEMTACLHRQGKEMPDGRPDTHGKTARMLSEAIVEIYRLSGWPPWRVASELAKFTRGGRRDVLRWARDGVPESERGPLWDRVEDLRQRFRRARHWGPRRVRRLRERGGCRLDLALEAGVELEDVRAWERGERRPTESEAEELERLERQNREGADDA
jgi:hypothetical protein